MEASAFRKSLEKIGGSPFYPGNSLQILKDGHPAFEEVFREMERARRLICVEFYIFHDDETGWELAELLAKKSKEGVRVTWSTTIWAVSPLPAASGNSSSPRESRFSLSIRRNYGTSICIFTVTTENWLWWMIGSSSRVDSM